MKQFISHQRRRFANAFLGYITAFKLDLNVKLQVIGSLFFIGFGYFMWPLTDVELLSLILAYALIIITELQNTSFELALDRIHPELHEEIGASKDIAAAAVLTAGIFAVVVIGLIIFNRI